MKEKPILFSSPMVRAILAGDKTQTRRVIMPQLETGQFSFSRGLAHDPDKLMIRVRISRGVDRFCGSQDYIESYSPYGQTGDRLWVRETWAVHEYYDGRAPCKIPNEITIECRESPEAITLTPEIRHRRIRNGERGKWRPSILMPKWACRIWLEIVSIRIQRLQEISEEDAKMEGVRRSVELLVNPFHKGAVNISDNDVAAGTYKKSFQRLWDTLNAKRGFGWGVNPWVWVITFKRVERSAAK